MTAALIIQLITGTGFLAGVGVLLNYVTTRRSTKTKGSADAYQSYRTFIAGATEDRDREHDRVKADRDRLWGVRESLIDLVQDLMALARSKGAHQSEMEPFYDRLDEVRSR